MSTFLERVIDASPAWLRFLILSVFALLFMALMFFVVIGSAVYYFFADIWRMCRERDY